jgi:hypothetical protein
MFEGTGGESPEITCAALLEALPLVHSSLQEQQKADDWCVGLREKILNKQPSVDSFVVHKELLAYFPKRAKRCRWMVPCPLRNMMLKYYHDGVLSGHLGAKKTFHRIATNFWWPKMRSDVFDYIKGCESCVRAKPAHNTKVETHDAKPSAEPMEKLFIGFVGPLVRSKQGNIAILVVVDAFSKFVTFYPVRRMISRVVVHSLERSYFPVYGTPKMIVSDNAKLFCCKEFRDLCLRWGIEHRTTTPYYPQASLAERVNRNLKSALKIFHSKSQVTWDEDLPCLSLAFNTAIHESTGSTPDKLFLGREMKCPLGVRCELTSLNKDSSTGTTQDFWTQAYRNLKRACSKVAQRYNQGRIPHAYRVGDRVVFHLNLASSKAKQIT